ncbi:MAG TPA: DPP IV N-terminal domain-containing protein, partial [Ignavibacteria bacterium]
MLYARKFLILAALLVIASESDSQYVGFGRNKVQYNNFDWHTLSTEHFKIFFYPEMRELAEIGAAYAEETYKIHQQNFNYSLVDTVPIIFYSTATHFRETNTTPGLIPDGVGGFFEFVKGRVVIPFDGSLGNFKHVIRHELTHVFMTAKIGNVLRLHRQTIDRMPPLWFTEGLAEYLSTEWDPTAEMIIKDAVLNNYMVGLDDWERFYGTFLMYKMGQNALIFLAENFGKEKVLALTDNFWMAEDFSSVMEKTIGKDYSGFDKEWLYWLKKKFLPQFGEEDNPSINSTSIYTGGFGHKPAYYSDGKKEEVYFIGNKSGYTNVYKINLKNKRDITTVIQGESSEEFEEFHYFRTGLDISSKGILAFATKSGATDAMHLYDIKEEKVIMSYHFDNIVQIGSPSFSSDGKIIIFPAIDMSGKSDLYIFEIKQGKLTRLTNDYYDDRDPDISPDGKSIVFSSDRTSYGYNNRYNLFLYNLENNSISYLTSGDEIDYSPQYSPNGKKIVFTSTIGGVQNIWIKELGEGNQPEGNQPEGNGETTNKEVSKIKKLTNFTTGAFDPKWAGEDKIVFASYENKKLSVRMLNNAEKLIDTPKSTQLLSFDKIKELWSYSKIKSISRKNELKYQREYSLDLATSTISADPVFGTTAGGIIA